ncbi:MAG: metallophosphoesterase family protein [Mariprofundus sp.]|nr:metallophosphoesterase family protein [Mariprofundus sp.]
MTSESTHDSQARQLADHLLPNYRGLEWVGASLPCKFQNWLDGNKHCIRQNRKNRQQTRQSIDQLMQQYPWRWPKRPIVFISDLHADADAFFASLIASGGIKKTGPADHQFKLTASGERALFILGGDFFDKGPSNLRLLRAVRLLINTGARVRLLAGNHDVRVLFGMRSAGAGDDAHNGHFFIRMGAKAGPLLREIRDHYLSGPKALKGVPGAKACKKMLYPGEAWWKTFPEHAAGRMPASLIEKELNKIEEKAADFEQVCAAAGLSLREAYAAAMQWQSMFLSPDGEFYWFYKRMRLAYRKGAFLFVHAGMDDHIANMLHEHGAVGLNRLFKKQLHGNAFDFYYGSVANTIRTKYRCVDKPLSRKGAMRAHQAGIHVIVHGHKNLHRGQRIFVRKSMLNFECDVTLDIGSRRKEGLCGNGAGATMIDPQGYIMGISSDYDRIKLFDASAMLSS